MTASKMAARTAKFGSLDKTLFSGAGASVKLGSTDIEAKMSDHMTDDKLAARLAKYGKVNVDEIDEDKLFGRRGRRGVRACALCLSFFCCLLFAIKQQYFSLFFVQKSSFRHEKYGKVNVDEIDEDKLFGRRGRRGRGVCFVFGVFPCSLPFFIASFSCFWFENRDTSQSFSGTFILCHPK